MCWSTEWGAGLTRSSWPTSTRGTDIIRLRDRCTREEGCSRSKHTCLLEKTHEVGKGSKRPPCHVLIAQCKQIKRPSQIGACKWFSTISSCTKLVYGSIARSTPYWSIHTAHSTRTRVISSGIVHGYVMHTRCSSSPELLRNWYPAIHHETLSSLPQGPAMHWFAS